MYIPKHYHWGFPFLVVCSALYVHENMDVTWDVALFIQLPLAFIASAWSLYLWQAGVMYQGYMTQVDKRPGEPVEIKTYPNLSRVMDAPVYSQVTDRPRFDMERQFAKILLTMHTYKPNDEAVDLREEFWKKPNKFGSREAYVAVRAKWEARQIVMKSAARKNAPYKVVDWRAVELIANGNPLP